MKNDTKSRRVDLSLSDLEAIDVICHEFENEWRNGRPARFEDYLSRIDTIHVTRLVYELVHIEVEQRAKSGEEVSTTEIQQRAPAFVTAIEQVFREIDESKSLGRIDHHSSSEGDSAVQYASLFRLVQTETSTPKLSAGKHLGKFRLLERIGSGGFGTVWKAVDSELNRVVAIKIPHAQSLDPTFQRFEKEARVLAKLSHPNVVRIFSVEREKDVVFIVTDFIEGVSLAKALSGVSLDFVSSADLCATIADTLQFAHDAGIIHRDVKPANVLLDINGNPYLTDFGMARDLDVDTGLTETGLVFGTPSYMSPEQARGDGKWADARTDIYSLGVILFQLLTSDLPFRGSHQVLMNSILYDEPRNPRSLDRQIPPDLDTICRKCLEKDPARRYGSAALLAQDLRSWLQGRPISARPVSRIERGIRWCKRQPLVAGLLGSILLLSISVFSIVTWLWQSAVAANHDRRMAQVNTLLTAEPSSVSILLQQISADADEAVLSCLRRHADDVTLAPHKRLRMQESLLKYDTHRLAVIVESLLEAPVDEVPHVIESLEALSFLSQPLIAQRLSMQSGKPSDLLRLASALVRINPSDPLLAEYAAPIAVALCKDEPPNVVKWSEILLPMAFMLRDPLMQTLRSSDVNPSLEVVQAISTLFKNSPSELLELLPKARPDHFRMIVGLLDGHRDEVRKLLTGYIAESEAKNRDGTITFEEARSAAIYCLASISLELEYTSMGLLNPGKSGAARHHLIVLPSRLGLDPNLLLRRLMNTSDPFEASGYLLALGQFKSVKSARQWKDDIVDVAKLRFLNDPDPSVHSAAEWSLRQWVGESAIANISKSIESRVPSRDRRWFIHPEGFTFLIFDVDATKIDRGSPSNNRFAISSSEVSCQQIARWSPLHMSAASSKTPTHPAGLLSGIDARRYCEWLSAKESLSSEKGNIERLGEKSPGRLRTYRLPTDSEWTIAARSGTSGLNFIGTNTDSLCSYAWLAENSVARTHATRSLMPNPFGCFDIIGNVSEWAEPEGLSIPFIATFDSLTKQPVNRLLKRGQNINVLLISQTVEHRVPRSDSEILPTNGFRLARSLDP